MNHSDKYKLIFFHYPKCAGKSVAKAIGIDTGHSDNITSELKQTILLGFDIRYWTHKSNKQRWETYTKFTIVRNPWDRMVSLYHFRLKENDLYKQFPKHFWDKINPYGGDKVGPDGKVWGFKRWLFSIYTKGFSPEGPGAESWAKLDLKSKLEIPELSNPTLKQAIETHVFFTEKDSYLKLCLDTHGRQIESVDIGLVTVQPIALVRERIEWFNHVDIISDENGNWLVDYVLRFENLEEDWNRLFMGLGYDPPKLPVKNKSKHKHYFEYYDEDTMKFIHHLYKKDIEVFGYTFENNGE